LQTEETHAPPAPRRTEWNREYFDSAAADGLVLQHCEQCGKTFYYPRIACPGCLSTELVWQRATGFGTLYSFSVVWRPKHPAFDPLVPILLAAVELDEGPLIITTLESCEPDDAEIGMRVEACFGAVAGGPVLPRFRPVSAA
jgi:uncharacterized OB-fold protein